MLQARGEVTRVSAVYDDARTAVARAEARAGVDPLMSRAELDAARVAAGQAAADVKRAEADLSAAEAAVTEAQIDVDHTVIRSPIDGVVISRYVDVGQTITARIQAPVLFTVADLRRMHLLAEVGEADVGGLRTGSDVSFQVESIGDRTFEGTISSVRLEPVVEQPAASTSGSSAASPAVGTSGTAPPSGSATGSRSAGGAASAPGTSGATQSGSAQPGGASGSSSSAGTPSPGSAPSTSQASSRTPRLGVVTYTAVIDVDNVDRAVPPGGTAIVTLDGPRRDNVVRIPNSALSFQPPAAVFEAVGQPPPALAGSESAQDGSPSGTRDRDVWKYEGGRFVPVHVRLGLADDTWTEVVSGSVHPGDALVTSAVPRKAGIH